jgi:hypothetical protein
VSTAKISWRFVMKIDLEYPLTLTLSPGGARELFFNLLSPWGED